MVVMDSKWYVMSKNVSKCFQNGNIWKHFCRNSRNGQKNSIRFPNISILETFGNIF